MSGTVCLTFDFDAVSLWTARGTTRPGPISRGESGARAAPRILRLLESRSIPSTWFVAGHTADMYPMLCRDVAAAGHEIGLHGYAHEPVSALDPAGEREMIARAMDTLCKLTGRAPAGNRTPSWDFTESTVDLLMEFGIEYDSSLMGTGYTPYFAGTGDMVPAQRPYAFGDETPLVELPVSWTLEDHPHFEYLRLPSLLMPGLRRPREMFENFLDDVRRMIREEPDGVCVITFHPQVIGRGHRMFGLEWFLDRLEALGVTYTTCADAAAGFRRSHAYAA